MTSHKQIYDYDQRFMTDDVKDKQMHLYLYMDNVFTVTMRMVEQNI